MKDIGSHAFAYCAKLERVNIPQGVEHIGSNVWSMCGSLKEIEIPSSVTELESYAFSDCSSLTKAVLPANNHLLGEWLFIGCGLLREIVCESPEPPTFDCGSPVFDESEAALYRECRLKILPGKEPLYSAAPVWRRFFE